MLTQTGWHTAISEKTFTFWLTQGKNNRGVCYVAMSLVCIRLAAVKPPIWIIDYIKVSGCEISKHTGFIYAANSFLDKLNLIFTFTFTTWRGTRGRLEFILPVGWTLPSCLGIVRRSFQSKLELSISSYTTGLVFPEECIVSKTTPILAPLCSCADCQVGYALHQLTIQKSHCVFFQVVCIAVAEPDSSNRKSV